MLKGTRGISKDYVRKLLLEKIWANIPNKILERKVMASPPTVTITTGSPTLTETWPVTGYSGGGSGVNNVSGEYVSYIKTRNIIPYVNGGTRVSSQNILYILSPPTYSRSNNCYLFEHFGSDLEFELGGTGGKALFKINGEYVSLTPTAISTNPSFVKLAFGSIAKRRIELIYTESPGRIFTNINETIVKAKPIGPSLCFVGDSFSLGAGITNPTLSSFPMYFSDYSGWEDVSYSGVGSTGYLSDVSGTRTNYRQRIQHDVLDNNYDIVVFTGGWNDQNTGKTYSEMYSECKTLFELVRSSKPNMLVIVCAPFWTGGLGTYTQALDNVWRGIKDAATNTQGVYYIDLLEDSLPLGASSAGLLTSAVTAGATTFIANTYYAPKTSVKIGSYDRVTIASVSGSAPGPWTHTIYEGTIKTNHSIGDTVVQVGGSYLSGSGKVGSTTGKGNADIFVQSDGVHPTELHQQMIARMLLEKITTSFSY